MPALTAHAGHLSERVCGVRRPVFVFRPSSLPPPGLSWRSLSAFPHIIESRMKNRPPLFVSRSLARAGVALALGLAMAGPLHAQVQPAEAAPSARGDRERQSRPPEL